MQPAMEEAITVTKLNIENQWGYLLIGWQANSFEMYLFLQNLLWKGSFSANRLAGFSRNLQMTESDYYKSLRRCLSEERNHYNYELKSGFFYWKRKIRDSDVIEGFIPLEIDHSPRDRQPDLIEVLLALNTRLKEKASDLQYKYKTIQCQYKKCLNDTEEFLGLKLEMERSLCEKFLILIKTQKADGGKCD